MERPLSGSYLGAVLASGDSLVVEDKSDEIRQGRQPRVLDLFAGCGGLSLGFQRAGFRVACGVELDPEAAESHGINFGLHRPEERAAGRALPLDIRETDPTSLVASLGFEESPEHCIDVVVGGPPCQAFARVGRAKLREVAEHPQAFRRDPRSDLYLRYLQYVVELQPLALLMENVPDVINYGGHNIPEEMCDALEAIGYVASYTLLNAAYYGVPQMRERMFLVAFRQELTDCIGFPAPTHWLELPRGYTGSRQVALKHLKPTLFQTDNHYVEPPRAGSGMPPAVTAEQAIADLPPITDHLTGKLKRGARRFTTEVPYGSSVEHGSYAHTMRTWPEFESARGISDHVIRSLPRDYELFREMRPGDQYPQAHAHAMRRFNRLLDEHRARGESLGEGTRAFANLKASIVPPYDHTKFPNKWRKMERDRPARSLMAHIGKDTYSHIHYDDEQARTISVREAARLQSFPDGFRFSGAMNSAFRQIGNAVPPLMAYALAKMIAGQLGERCYAGTTRSEAAYGF